MAPSKNVRGRFSKSALALLYAQTRAWSPVTPFESAMNMIISRISLGRSSILFLVRSAMPEDEAILDINRRLVAEPLEWSSLRSSTRAESGDVRKRIGTCKNINVRREGRCLDRVPGVKETR